MLFTNLPATVFETIGMKTDHRWNKWVKFVTKIDPKGNDGYAFSGDFVKDGTIELEMSKSRLLLCAAETGSAKYRSYDYAFAVLHPDGRITKTGVGTDGAKGWALRLRDAGIDLLNSLNGVTPAVSPRQQFLSVLQERFPQLSEDEIVTAALNHYEMATR